MVAILDFRQNYLFEQFQNNINEFYDQNHMPLDTKINILTEFDQMI